MSFLLSNDMMLSGYAGYNVRPSAHLLSVLQVSYSNVACLQPYRNQKKYIQTQDRTGVKIFHRQNSGISQGDKKIGQEIITDKYYTIKDDYKMPKYPIVLSHGFSGFDKLIYIPQAKSFFSKSSSEVGPSKEESTPLDKGLEFFQYWRGIKQELVSRGCTVIVGKVPPFAKIEDRAKTLNNLITKEVDHLTKHHTNTELYNDDEVHDESKKMKVNLIAHSMGGWDCRYLISELEHRNYEVVSLTTIGTPHRGSSAADYIMEHFPSSLINVVAPSIPQLTTKACIERSKKLKDSPDVLYFSCGAFYRPTHLNLFYLTWKIVEEREGPNDGVISVESSKWGKYLGTLENVDHLDLINWVSTAQKIKNKISGNSHSFNPIALYLDIADQLAKRGL